VNDGGAPPPSEVLRIRSKYSFATTGGTGPISATLLAPRVDPPLGPSVKSHAFPDTSAASDVGPAAACAVASAGKLSTRQYSGPDGSCWTFFSATGSMTNPCAHAGGGKAHIQNPNTAMLAATRSFMAMTPGLTWFARFAATLEVERRRRNRCCMSKVQGHPAP
jgi:hypothetical protein